MKLKCLVRSRIDVKHPLQQSITTLQGVGEERASDLSLLGVRTISDLLQYFPYKHEDRRIRDLTEVGHEEKVTIEGQIHSEPAVRFYGRKKSRMTVRVLVDNRYLVTCILFNRHFAKKQFTIGKTAFFTGKLDKHRMQLTVQDYSFQPKRQPDAEQDAGGIVPVYTVGEHVSTKFLHKLIEQALQKYQDHIVEILPNALIQKYKLMERRNAIKAIHLPQDMDEFKLAKRRMIYEEFFLFQLKMHALRRTKREQIEGVAHQIDTEQIQHFLSSLPYKLTNAQQNALQDITKDMTSTSAMNRLLQGDVGSGKTAVAAIALYASNTAGCQGAIMVPTEILAEQHYQSMQSFFKDTSVQIALLTGSSKAKERREILAGLQMGLIDIVIGTHALIQDTVVFSKLGLVVIDEQHRFGVEQRRKLRQKGTSPDVLFMTATPIPRTLAITAFGDMDVSVIDELPAGRKRIETYWVKPDMFDRALDFIRKELAAGRQAYFICPLIEESEKLDVQNAIDVHAQLTQALPQFKVALLHGRLHSDEKETVMREFSQNEAQLLVSTTVVEVGVNVPNATLMIVQDADRFGLSQLHQLRGRVGRGEHQSYCILIADPKSEIGMERMRIMKETSDGFELAQQDLELRGPGDFFGTKQSGLPEFVFGDMIHDYRILEIARDDAAKLVQSDAFWQEQIYPQLLEYLVHEGVLDSETLD
ncbi:ATP-dependent DNA helicase RecG [Bacillus horti]|uniref:ATP-dependent DNA helicase RecG n=1 Tax=Caldalkalibacillus horti TaxID=77523 RepID=A0ABT9W268_9BACI|nr:ATP-dependent DNA helicase RecG [Bacillus horti]